MRKIIVVLLTFSMIISCCTAFAAIDEVTADADALTVEDILTVPLLEDGYLIDNLDLDTITVGEVNASPIAWESSNTNVISNSGVVTRGDTTETVTVTATIGSGDNTMEKPFVFTVPAKSISVNGMPNMTEMYVDETFSGALPGNISYLASDDTVDTYSVEKGKLKLVRSAWSSAGKEPGFEFKKDSSGTAITGTAVQEFTVSTTGRYLRIAFVAKDWAGYNTYIVWRGAGSAPIIDYTNDGASAYSSHTLDVVEGNSMKLTVYWDFTNKKFSLWVNNKLAVENKSFRVSTLSNIGFFRIYTVTSGDLNGIGTITVDNLKMYSASESGVYTDGKSVYNSMITGVPVTGSDGKQYLFDDLSFEKTTGSNGSTIAYSTSDVTAIDANGAIIRGITDKDVAVYALLTDSNGSY